MSHRFTLSLSNTLTPILTASLLLSCAMGTSAPAEELLSRSPERGGVGLALQLNPPAKPRILRRGDLNDLDERLSIIVTDKVTTSAIKFSDVMKKLADDLKVDRLTLFQRWWDTANKAPGVMQEETNNVFCDSEAAAPDEPSTKNGFLYQCPRTEGRQASLDPFTNEGSEAGYTAIAFSNRFDMADQISGQHCGEFRIVFARNSGFINGNNRNLIIFEALVPNPDPPKEPVKPTSGNIFVNLKGCKPIVEFWRKLSDPMSTTDRGRALKGFFLNGLLDSRVAPVVDAKHYAGGPDSGQIRTNQFMKGPHDWLLREFKIEGTNIVPATAKSNPGNPLFALRGDPRRFEFAEYVAGKEVLDLLRGGVDEAGNAVNERSADNFGFALATERLDHLNSFEGDQRTEATGDIVKTFKRNGPVGKKVEAARKSAGSSLTIDNIIRRIRTQTCAGCHHFSGGDKELGIDPKVFPDGWPGTLGNVDSLNGFTHVSEIETEIGEDDKLGLLDPSVGFDDLSEYRLKRVSHLNFRGPDGPNSRYRISDALKFLFLPQRYKLMLAYLNEVDEPQ